MPFEEKKIDKRKGKKILKIRRKTKKEERRKMENIKIK
jgi:hypothetical protein